VVHGVSVRDDLLDLTARFRCHWVLIAEHDIRVDERRVAVYVMRELVRHDNIQDSAEQRVLERTIYHSLGKLPEPESDFIVNDISRCPGMELASWTDLKVIQTGKLPLHNARVGLDEI
jgi:hypothetical protein